MLLLVLIRLAIGFFTACLGFKTYEILNYDLSQVRERGAAACKWKYHPGVYF